MTTDTVMSSPETEAQAIRAAVQIAMRQPADAAGLGASPDARAQQVGRLSAVLLSALRSESHRLMLDIERRAMEADSDLEKEVLQRIQQRALARRNGSRLVRVG